MLPQKPTHILASGRKKQMVTEASLEIGKKTLCDRDNRIAVD
ncbi:MAG TPA: hypothetical protein VGG64_25790 [Pirellulales bacterium]